MTSSAAVPPAGYPLSRGEWLRVQRQARGWSVPEMRVRLRQAAREAGDVLPGNECLGVMIRRWEKDSGGVSERYRLHYCGAFGIPLDGFGSAPPPADAIRRAAAPAAAAAAAVAAVPGRERALDVDERAELAGLRRQCAALTARHESLLRDLIGWAYKAMLADGDVT
jgi:hypothetical protein